LKRIKNYFVILLVLTTLSILTVNSSVTARNEVNILCFIENGFGGSYYINKGFLESYNFTVTTTSSTPYVVGCKNNGKNINDTTSDVLVSDIVDEDLSDYDCLLVPSGGHWSNLVNTARTLELIQLAHEEGILVAGICTGMIVLAAADILENVSVAYNLHASDWLSTAGADMTGYPVVSDQGVITGGFGGGVGFGPDYAPNEDFCEKIKEEIEIANQAIFAFGIFIGLLIIASCVSLIRRKRS
jgi:putative intracellular protease/amidase